MLLKRFAFVEKKIKNIKFICMIKIRAQQRKLIMRTIFVKKPIIDYLLKENKNKKKLKLYFKKILGSKIFFSTLFALLYGITAISPDILKNPIVFCNYIGFIVLNCFIQERDSYLQNQEFKNEIYKLQNEIDKLKS